MSWRSPKSGAMKCCIWSDGGDEAVAVALTAAWEIVGGVGDGGEGLGAEPGARQAHAVAAQSPMWGARAPLLASRGAQMGRPILKSVEQVFEKKC